MYVAIVGPKGKESVSVREDYYIGAHKKKTKIVKTYGPLKKLLAENPDFVEELRAELKREAKEKKEGRSAQVAVSLKPIGSADDGYQFLRFGHAIVKKIWNDMRLDKFFEAHCAKRNAEELEEALFYSVARRLSDPSSIRHSFSKQLEYAGMKELTLDILYKILGELSEFKDDLIEHIGSFMGKNSSRDLDHVCYDVTNYYFESQKAGELRLFGFSKEHKNNEVIVVMGLLIDSNGIPITFKLFPGNTMDQNTLCDAVVDLKDKYGINEITVVADRGMNSNDNLIYLSEEGHHFVVSYTLKKASAEIKEKCLCAAEDWDVADCDKETGELIYASKVLDMVCTAKVRLTEEEIEEQRRIDKEAKKRGRTAKYKSISIPAKIHVTYSRKRAEKDAGDRQRALNKLYKRIGRKQAKSSMKYGSNKFLEFDLNENDIRINGAAIEEAARYDGFYAVITDRMDLGTEEAMQIYRDQWRIEESFRILKTDLNARPAFVWTDEHIIGHFTLCYLALCIIRYIQYIAGEDMSAERVMNAIYEPIAIIIGDSDKPYLGLSVTEDYLTLSKALGLPLLRKTMSVLNFKTATKLDPKRQITKLIGEN